MNTLRLNEFREIYKQSKALPFWLRHLLLGLLVWLEDRYITAKVEQTVTDAIEQYHQQVAKDDAPNWKEDATVTITENPNSSHQLPTLTISAPYSKGFPRNE